MNSLESLTLDQILKTYDLPHRLLTYFASQCAKDALSKIKDPDPKSTLAVDVAERFGNGEDFSQEYLEKVYNDAAAVYYPSALAAAAALAATASYASHAAAASAYSTATATAYAALAASYAATATASYAAHAASYKDLLIKLIETRLTKLEQIIIFG